MPTLIIGILILVLVLWALNGFSKADPQRLLRLGKPIGGVGALGLAAFLGMRGHFEVALPLGIAGLSLLGWMPFGPAGFGSRTQKSAGQLSRVRTAFVEMELEHDTGSMRGRILAGRHAGSALDTLNTAALVELLGGIDDESRALLAAYLDRRDPAWRQQAGSEGQAGRGNTPGGGKMTEEEAYQILGLARGASADDIGRAHRSLMKRLHPDQGGSTYLAARVNEAKDVLLRRR